VFAREPAAPWAARAGSGAAIAATIKPAITHLPSFVVFILFLLKV
jgi:hypothetical protein